MSQKEAVWAGDVLSFRYAKDRGNKWRLLDFPVHNQIITPSSFNLILRNYTSGLAELDISVSHFF